MATFAKVQLGTCMDIRYESRGFNNSPSPWSSHIFHTNSGWDFRYPSSFIKFHSGSHLDVAIRIHLRAGPCPCQLNPRSNDSLAASHSIPMAFSFSAILILARIFIGFYSSSIQSSLCQDKTRLSDFVISWAGIPLVFSTESYCLQRCFHNFITLFLFILVFANYWK